MSETVRKGGRSAHITRRKNGPSLEFAPVRPGFGGGTYQPLKESDIKNIHEASLEVLERIGIADATENWKKIVIENGGWLTDDGRLCFPRTLVETALDTAARDFILYGRDPKYDIDVSGKRVHFGGSSASMNIQDLGGREWREPSIVDLYDQVRLEDALENMHFVIRPAIARDLPDARDLDINTAYACMVGTSKHIITSFFTPENLNEAVKMFDISIGGNGDGAEFRKRPFAHTIVTFVVPPLKFSPESCNVIDAAVRAGMPVLLITAGQSGATAPATLLGTLVQSNAELLAGLAVINLMSPGHQTIVGNWSLVSDLRTGAFVGGCSEMGLLAAGAAQIINSYGLPSSVAAGVSSSKMPDAQSGWEKGYLTTMAALAGANMINQSAGMVGDFMMSSFEAYTMDNDMIGGVIRAVRGIDVSKERLAISQMESVVKGAGHFLGEAQTLSLMESEFYYNKIADRQSLKDWHLTGMKDMRERAITRTQEVMASHFPHHIQPEVDERIRQDFPIKLPREAMRPETTAWKNTSGA